MSDDTTISKTPLRVREAVNRDGKMPRESAVATSLSEHFYFSWISQEMQTVARLALEISRTDLPVLIVGESGAGKEVTALQIHALSENQGLPFVKLNCTGFGTESFQTQLERIEHSLDRRNGDRIGTVFFDEISELDASFQRRVLQLIPEGNELKDASPFSTRIICCTSGDLESEIRAGRFRVELFYRLNGVCLRLPALRRMKEDIPGLAQFFAKKYARLFHRAETPLKERTLGRMVDYDWPGNIRELENVVRKIAALGDEELAIHDLSDKSVAPSGTPRVSPTCSLKAAARAASQQAERELILQTLTRTHWNRKKAAEALQISYKSLLYKLKQIEFEDSQEG